MAKDLQKKEPMDVVDPAVFDVQGSTGFEGTSSETFKTPFLKVLQALSPELKKTDPKYIEGAEMGMFCNSATQMLYSSVNVIVLKVEHVLLTWKPNRGGFVSRDPKSAEESVVSKREGLHKWDQDGNDVMDTIEFFCMNADDPLDLFILSLSAASIKHAKGFATRLHMLKANGKAVKVSWAGVWQIGLVEEKNEKGSWYTIGATPEFIRFVTKEERDNLIMPAKEMLDKAVTDYTTIEPGAGDQQEDGDAPF